MRSFSARSAATHGLLYRLIAAAGDYFQVSRGHDCLQAGKRWIRVRLQGGRSLLQGRICRVSGGAHREQAGHALVLCAVGRDALLQLVAQFPQPLVDCRESFQRGVAPEGLAAGDRLRQLSLLHLPRQKRPLLCQSAKE